MKSTSYSIRAVMLSLVLPQIALAVGEANRPLASGAKLGAAAAGQHEKAFEGPGRKGLAQGVRRPPSQGGLHSKAISKPKTPTSLQTKRPSAPPAEKGVELTRTSKRQHFDGAPGESLKAHEPEINARVRTVANPTEVRPVVHAVADHPPAVFVPAVSAKAPLHLQGLAPGPNRRSPNPAIVDGRTYSSTQGTAGLDGASMPRPR